MALKLTWTTTLLTPNTYSKVHTGAPRAHDEINDTPR